ncbi:MAG: Tex family protein [Bacteroidota bacterium]
MTTKYPGLIAQHLNIAERKVTNTIQLLTAGATIPFIARYRKEATGSLDEVQVGDIKKRLDQLEEIDKRRESILKSIEEQGKLTDALRQRIEATYDATVLEDLYLPYKRKRKTRASVAREQGLEPLAQSILDQRNPAIENLARPFINEAVPDVAAALKGARDIIAEWMNEDEKTRNAVRYAFEKGATIRSKVARGKEEAGAKYRDYFAFEETLNKCPAHRLMAIRRGEEEGFLRVSIGPDTEMTTHRLENFWLKGYGAATDQVRLALEDAYKRLLSPAIETEFRNSAKAKADEEAIGVFTANLRQLLLAAPLGQKATLAIDPGFRTGCKVVCLDANGVMVHHSTIYPHPPQSQSRQAVQQIQDLAQRYAIEALAIGNGTAGRETHSLFRTVDFGRPLPIFLVNESGASIYSASEAAREEFPDQDVTVRGSVSIGRRLMDPLAELVKIDPKSIGVGQYQHDVNQSKLKDSLDREVEHCVNAVGINLNTASKHLLHYVSGLGPSLAQNIVNYRQENGSFQSRSQLKKVPRMGEKAFEQCAGFLRIRNGKNPLDNTAVHPERYALVRQMATDLGCQVDQLIKDAQLRKQIPLQRYVAEDIGLPTLTDILSELEKPGLDPRGAVKAIEFDDRIHSIEDLKTGIILSGVVNNITNFGAFVDIGIKESGLVHISQIANKFIKNPAEVLKLGQEVRVKVMDIDLTRKRIQLSMKEV